MDFRITKLRVLQSAHESGAAVYDLSAVITAFKSWIAREASLRSKCSRTLGETNVFAGPMPNAKIDLAGLPGRIDSVGRFECIVPTIVGDRNGNENCRERLRARSSYGRSKRGARGYMFSRILLTSLLAVVAQARAAAIKGTIVLNAVGGQPMANVQVVDSARTGGPWASGSDGAFTLDYPDPS